MKRKQNGRLILVVGVGFAAPLFLLGVPIHAQQSSRSMDAPPGMEEGGGPFSGVTHGPTTFSGKQAEPDKPAVSTFPGEVHGVTRYPSGLPMPNAEVAILNGDANVDRTTVSGSDGSFVFKNLKPGEYQLTARKDGFAPSPITKVALDAGKIATTDVPLGPSLAVSPVDTNSAALLRTSHVPTYRMQPASLHLGATDLAATDNTIRPTETASSASSQPAASSSEQPDVSVLLDEVRALSKRVEELEAERKKAGTPDQPAAAGSDASATADAAQDAAARLPRLLLHPSPAPGSIWRPGEPLPITRATRICPHPRMALLPFPTRTGRG